MFASATPVFAAHPMLAEDTGTQGAGNFELELGYSQARADGTRTAEFGPQLSYGVLDNLDLIVRPTWLHVRSADSSGTSQGFGDTALDFKWRFPAQGALTFGVRAGADLPTGDADKELGNGKTSPHAILIATWLANPWMFSANLDYVYDPLIGDRRNLWGASTATAYSANDVWRFTAEVGTAMNPDISKASWLTVARFGVIATIVKGLDVDAGYQVRLTRAAPVDIVLAGVTLRW
jgi:hypothetical protein